MPVQLKLLLATIFWGATPTIGRALAEYKAPFVVVCGRFIVALIFLLWFTWAARAFVRLPRQLWWRFALLGVSGIFLHNGLLYKGLEFSSATTASVILGLIAMQVVILDLIFYRRVPDRVTVAGVFLGFLGTAFVITNGDLASIFSTKLGWGELLIFLSALGWAVYSVVSREILQQLSALVVTTYSTAIGVLFLIPFLFAQPTATVAVFSAPSAVAMILFLGYVGTALGFLWYCQAVAQIGTVGAAIYTNLVPLFGVLSAAIFLGEDLNQAVIGGGAMVLAGLMLVNRPWQSVRARRVSIEPH